MNESCTIKPLPFFKGERRTYRGILQPFADHAHGHYVFGIVREGERELVLNGELLRIKKEYSCVQPRRCSWLHPGKRKPFCL